MATSWIIGSNLGDILLCSEVDTGRSDRFVASLGSDLEYQDDPGRFSDHQSVVYCKAA